MKMLCMSKNYFVLEIWDFKKKVLLSLIVYCPKDHIDCENCCEVADMLLPHDFLETLKKAKTKLKKD